MATSHARVGLFGAFGVGAQQHVALSACTRCSFAKALIDEIGSREGPDGYVKDGPTPRTGAVRGSRFESTAVVNKVVAHAYLCSTTTLVALQPMRWRVATPAA